MKNYFSFCMSVSLVWALSYSASPSTAWAQDGGSNVAPEFEAELDESLDEAELPPLEDLEEPQNNFVAPEEERPARSIVPKEAGFPTAQPNNNSPASPSGRFVKPKGPPGGGILEVPHPNAAKGLLRIEKDGSYIYRTRVPEKSRSTSFRAGFLTTPLIRNPQGISFGDIYGSDGLIGLVGEYEWQPFRRFGALGFQLGTGLVVARGNGRFANGSLAEEIYNLAVIPASALLVYRFEYVRRQWVVPFISGGGTLYGLAEFRDDGKPPVLAVSPAVVGGGGLHFNWTYLSPH